MLDADKKTTIYLSFGPDFSEKLSPLCNLAQTLPETKRIHYLTWVL